MFQLSFIRVNINLGINVFNNRYQLLDHSNARRFNLSFEILNDRG